MKTALLFFLLTFSLAAADLNLSWNDNSDNEDGFVVERSQDAGPFVEVGGTGVNEASYIDVDVPIGVSLKYRVKAVNQFGDSGYSNEVSIGTNPPASPDGLKQGNGNPLSWLFPKRLFKGVGPSAPRRNPNQ